jgi:hypothetical protein
VLTPQTQRKFGGQRSFSGHPHPRAQAVDFHSEFPLSDRDFWTGNDLEQSAGEIDDEYTSVNTAVQSAKSKECRHKGIGPDGKLLCPYLGNPDTAKCGFLHPAKELELKGKGISRATPGQPKKVHNLSQGLGVSYDGEREPSDSENLDA